MQLPAAQHGMEFLMHAVQRDHEIRPPRGLPSAAVAESPEDGVVGQHGGRHADRSTKAKVFLALVIPRTTMTRLPQPGGREGRRFETTTTSAVIGRSRIPKAV